MALLSHSLPLGRSTLKGDEIGSQSRDPEADCCRRGEGLPLRDSRIVVADEVLRTGSRRSCFRVAAMNANTLVRNFSLLRVAQHDSNSGDVRWPVNVIRSSPIGLATPTGLIGEVG